MTTNPGESDGDVTDSGPKFGDQLSRTSDSDAYEMAAGEAAVPDRDAADDRLAVRADLPERGVRIAGISFDSVVLEDNRIERNEDSGALYVAPVECQIFDNRVIAGE